MSNELVLELKKTLVIPEAYKSGFSFLELDAQKEFLTMEYGEIKYLFQAWPNDIARYIHELWRTGRMQIVYAYFMDRERTTQESIAMGEIAFNTAIMLHKGVPKEECNAFLHDLTCVSSNAHDNQEFGEEPLNLNAIEKMESIMEKMVSEYSSSMENL